MVAEQFVYLVSVWYFRLETYRNVGDNVSRCSNVLSDDRQSEAFYQNIYST